MLRRFVCVYLCLFALATQVAGSLLPIFSFRGLGPLWNPSVDPANGGENALYWIQALWLLVLAAIVTAAWSFFDRTRRNDEVLDKWFRLFVRLGLAAQMLEYGMTKIIQTQFAAPSLTTLVTPVGDLSLNSMLWASIGAAPRYQIFTGCAELLAGLLLLTPRTTLAGALLCLADLAQVLALNMAYDIGLKLTTIHLLLFAIFLLVPDLRRLANVFVWNRAAEASSEPPLFKTAGANRIALAAQLLIGVYLLATLTYINVGYWYAKGGGSPRSALYGIWDVEELVAQNDYDRRWRRVIFDAPDVLAIQRSDDSFARYGVSISEAGKRLALTKGGSAIWKAQFTFERPSADVLILDGEMDGHPIKARLRLVEFDTLRLLNSDFRWWRK